MDFPIEPKTYTSPDGWSYTIDPSPLPEYVFMRFSGAMDEAGAARFRADLNAMLTQLMRADITVSTSGAFILDYSDFDFSQWHLNLFLKKFGGLRGDGPVYVISSAQQVETSTLRDVMQYTGQVFPDTRFVTSREEAVQGVLAWRAAQQKAH